MPENRGDSAERAGNENWFHPFDRKALLMDQVVSGAFKHTLLEHQYDSRMTVPMASRGVFGCEQKSFLLSKSIMS